MKKIVFSFFHWTVPRAREDECCSKLVIYSTFSKASWPLFKKRRNFCDHFKRRFKMLQEKYIYFMYYQQEMFQLFRFLLWTIFFRRSTIRRFLSYRSRLEKTILITVKRLITCISVSIKILKILIVKVDTCRAKKVKRFE